MADIWTDNLYCAIYDNDTEFILLCINKGVDINKKGYELDFTPLEWAIHYNRLASVAVLIQQGANINSEYPGSPLIDCLRKERPEIAKYLIQLDADTCQPDKWGKTPLSWAVSTENEELIELLLDNGAESTIDATLIDAIDINNLRIVQLLLRRGASTNWQDTDGLTPLLKCIKTYGNVAIMEELLWYGADVNRVTRLGTPLLQCIEKDDLRVVREILDFGADVNRRFNGLYPIMDAIDRENIDLVKLLVERGASLTVSNRHGDSPLHKAVDKGNLGIVKYLVDAGAVLGKMNYFRQTALVKAIRNSNLEIEQFLLKAYIK